MARVSARGATCLRDAGRAGSATLALAIIGLASAIGCGGGNHATSQNPDGGSVGGNGASVGSAGAGGGGAGGNQPPPAGLSVLAGVPGGVGQRDDVGPAARLAEPAGLADDGQGHLYIADSGAATIRKLDLATGALTTLAGTPSYTNRPPAADGVGAAALFSNPTDIAFDGSTLYVADGFQVRRIDPASGAVTTIAGNGTASASVLTYPRVIAADNHGNLFVDSSRTVLLKIALATGQVTPLVGEPGSTDTNDGIGPAGHLGEPRALALDGAGALYVLDGGAVRRIDLATAALTSLPVTLPGFGTHHLAGMASDKAGHLYLSDLYFDTVYRLTPASGELVELAGADNVAGSEDGPPPEGHLNFPTSLIVGSNGAIYLSDRDNATIRQIDASTGAMTTLAGDAPHTGANDGAHDVARFTVPLGLSADASGNVFVADAGNYSIRRLNVATGTVTTIAGDSHTRDSIDGVGVMAKFIDPIGVAAGPSGTVYADDMAFNVRRIDIATATVTTIAGKVGEIGGGDGPGSIARFWTPVGITYDRAGTGTVLVTDANAAIRVIDMGSGNVSTAVRLPTLPDGGYALFNPIGVASPARPMAWATARVSMRRRVSPTMVGDTSSSPSPTTTSSVASPSTPARSRRSSAWRASEASRPAPFPAASTRHTGSPRSQPASC